MAEARREQDRSSKPTRHSNQEAEPHAAALPKTSASSQIKNVTSISKKSVIDHWSKSLTKFEKNRKYMQTSGQDIRPKPKINSEYGVPHGMRKQERSMKQTAIPKNRSQYQKVKIGYDSLNQGEKAKHTRRPLLITTADGGNILIGTAKVLPIKLICSVLWASQLEEKWRVQYKLREGRTFIFTLNAPVGLLKAGKETDITCRRMGDITSCVPIMKKVKTQKKTEIKEAWVPKIAEISYAKVSQQPELPVEQDFLVQGSVVGDAPEQNPVLRH